MRLPPSIAASLLLCAACSGFIGCHSAPLHHQAVAVAPGTEVTPRELYKSVLPEYRVEPPDILIIEAINLIPRQPYQLKTSDVVAIDVRGTFAEAPINGAYPIVPGGVVDLGIPYGSVKIAGLTVEQAEEEITRVLREQLREPLTRVSLLQFSGLQQIQGQHIIKPDGTVRLGNYGSVRIAGMTLDQAEYTVERHLTRDLENPDVSLDIFAFNSKFYYMVLQGAGFGDQIIKLQYTGNETVLDALAEIGGTSRAASNRIWIARPGPNLQGGEKILPVDLEAITRVGDIRTNYQLLPGDRIFVEEDQLVALDSNLAKMIAPVERIFGFSLLGASTATRFSSEVLRGGGNPVN